MAEFVPEELKRAALIHDMGEAYLGDIPRPIKGYLKEFVKLEERILRVIAGALKVPHQTLEALKIYDQRICIDEMLALMPKVSQEGEPLGVKIKCYRPDEAEHLFCQKLREVFPHRKELF